jgi:hypothetical protein
MGRCSAILSFQGFQFACFPIVSKTREAQLVNMALRRVGKGTLTTIIKSRVRLPPTSTLLSSAVLCITNLVTSTGCYRNIIYVKLALVYKTK